MSEADFFRAVTDRKVLQKLADTYPSPRKKHDVPLWVYIAGDISLRFHGVHHFHAFPYVVRSGGMIHAFGPQMGHKVTHPRTGDMSLRCEGFNDQNEYDRQDPCDQDYLRKMARRTDAKLLQRWFNRDVVDIFKQHHAFDSEGIFIGDATYLFVPDNSHYEGSSVLLFDEHNHPDEGRQNYALRTTIEERHRQLKCFSDLEDFSSRAFCLIVNQVVFVLLTYSLLPWYLLRAGRKELNPKTRTRTLELLQPTTTAILIYYQNYVACLSPLQHQELVLTLNEQARKKILAKTHRLCRSLAHQLDSARPP